MDLRCQCQRHTINIPHGQPTVLVICHCNKCRLITGGPYNVAAVFPPFEISAQTMSELGTFRQYGDGGASQIGHFCKGCGNRLFHVDGGQEGEQSFAVARKWISVSAARLVGFDWAQLGDPDKTVHVWASEAVVPVPERGLERWRIFEGQPPSNG